MPMRTNIRLVAADERGLPATLLVSAVLVVALAFGLKSYFPEGKWAYDFFFRRRFVQWVLLSAFAIGLVHLIRRVLPWLREKRALRQFDDDPSKLTPDTLVGRRWLQLQEARKECGRRNLAQRAKNLADQDEAEVNAAYRLSGDLVQVLPLIGFFGTVFGLSKGLYSSFLATGGTTTKDFAKAIAIAFDNTLLGLALTIILFALQSVLRKREEAGLLRLNLGASELVADAVQEPSKDPLQAAVEGLDATIGKQGAALKALGDQLEATRKALESPSAGVQELIQEQTKAVGGAVLKAVAGEMKADLDRIAGSVASRLEEQANKLADLLGERVPAFAQLPGLAEAVEAELPALKAELGSMSRGIQSISAQITQVSRTSTRPQWEELAAALNSLASALAERDTVMLDRLKALDEARAKLDVVAAETHGAAQAVAGFGTRLDAVPNERRTVEDLAASIKDLAQALAQRESVLLESLQGSLAVHSQELRAEIRQPRTIKFVEATGLPGGDGEAHAQ